MSYQGDPPNRRGERQRTGTGQQRGRPTGGQPQGPTPQQGQPTGGQPQQPTSRQYQQQQWQQPQGQGRPQGGGQQGQQPGGQQGQQPGIQQGQRSHQPGAGAQGPMTGTQQQPGAPGGQAIPQGGAGQGMPGGQPQPGGAQQQARMGGQASRARGRPGPQFKPMRVEEIIRTDVVTAKQDTPLPNVVASMAENDVGSVVVVDEDGTMPIGILTDRKIALALETTPDLAERTAGELTSGELVTGTTDMTVFDALDHLNSETIRRLPIVDEDGTIEGIVTLDDLLVLLGKTMGDVGDVVANQTHREA